MNEDLQILFEKYSAGNLTIAEKADFDLRLKSEVEFRESYKLYQEMHSYLSDKIRTDEIRKTIKDVGNDFKTESNKGNSKRIINILLAALVLFAALWFVSQYFLKKEPLQYAQIYSEPTWPVERGANSELSLIFALDIDSQYQEIVDRLKNVAMDEQSKLLWISEVFAHQELADSVLIYLPDRSGTSIIKRDRINFLEILALFKTENREKLENALAELPGNTDPYYAQKYDLLRFYIQRDSYNQDK